MSISPELHERGSVYPKVDSDPARATAAHMDRLAHTLEVAAAAFASATSETREAALFQALSTVGALYGALGGTSRNVESRILALHDACVRALGEAYGGDRAALHAATRMCRAIQDALSPRAAARGSDCPSRAPTKAAA